MVVDLENLAVMLYRVDCKRRMRGMSFEDKVSVARQISVYSLEEPIWQVSDDRYTLREFPGEKFTGLKLFGYLSEIMRDIAALDVNPEVGKVVDFIA